ncbi:MAG: BMC domain-containing protein [Chloroflexi bacterium]|nr:BMC domain-containing protein [Chloroflexota bacterium]GIW10750.1 MAG: BMC domain-containing protein [Dehalococcoidia bacterium]
MQENRGGVQLRTFAFIDRMQPQYAAFMGTMMNGDMPIAGQAELYVEVAPGNAIYRIADIALKSADVRPGMQLVERQFGILELHSRSQEAVRAAASAMLEDLHLAEEDRLAAQIVSAQVISNVDPYQAQLVNQMRRGSLLVPGEAMLVMEIAPAGYACLAANEAEKAADIKLVSISSIGPAGRIILSGTESQIQAARQAVIQAIGALRGRTGPPGQ